MLTYLCVCVCVYVCVRERIRERERENVLLSSSFLVGAFECLAFLVEPFVADVGDVDNGVVCDT